MKLFEFIKDIFDAFSSSDDPVKHCGVYKNHGCAHVDGFLCNMETCSTLREHELREYEQQLDIPFKDRIK